MGKKWFMALVLISVLGLAIYTASTKAQFYHYEAGFSGSYTYDLLLNSGLWLMLTGAGLGIIAGAAIALLRRARKPVGKQGAEALFNEWDVSFCILGGLILMVTGVMIGGIWSPRLVSQGATGFALNLHFLGIIMLLFGSMMVVTRTLVSGDFKRFAPLKDVFKFSRPSEYLPSYSWATWSLVVAVIAMAIKGSFLLIGLALNWPESVAVVIAAIHDILALIAILLALVALGFLIMERYPGAKAVPKTSKAPA